MEHDITLITLSASYGAGGSYVGPALAQRLGVPFVDRAIASGMADRLGVSEAEAARLDEDVERGLDRILGNLAPIADFYGDVDPAQLQRSAHHEAAEQVIREVAATGRAVILGRAGAVVLAGDDRALHVRLDGPPDARVEQAMRLEGVDRETAQRRRKKTDRAREAYVKRYYNCDARDAKLYDLVLDSTRLDLDTCVEVIAAACAPTPPGGAGTFSMPPSSTPASPTP
ncbi:MAG TPA: cytidylate kinase-like family protein [Baekduia sp.]|nr:cytidylate kinase-like family protein [Baekduia sp.]